MFDTAVIAGGLIIFAVLEDIPNLRYYVKTQKRQNKKMSLSARGEVPPWRDSNLPVFYR